LKLRLVPSQYLGATRFFIILLLTLLIENLCWCDYRDNPDPIPGWTNNASSDGANGIILNGAEIGFSSPVIAEIDGNTANGKEIAVGGSDGRIHVYHSDGSLVWENDTPIATCSGGSSNKLFSSPAVGELFGDGMPYVVVGYGGFGAKQCDGGVVAFRGSDGATQWVFSLKKFSKKEHFLCFSLFSVFKSGSR